MTLPEDRLNALAEARLLLLAEMPKDTASRRSLEAGPPYFTGTVSFGQALRAIVSALTPKLTRARIAAEVADLEVIAKALFLAEHPNAEWRAGRARIIWFDRAETALRALALKSGEGKDEA